MGQNNTRPRVWPLAHRRYLAAFAGVFLILAGCRDGSPAPRKIRGHDYSIGGVAHARGAQHPQRYCTDCHGDDLVGGTELEPSCYQCHGKTWRDGPADGSWAPADHTVRNEGYLHHPRLLSPRENCSSCHGSQLQGVSSGGLSRPGCELCHERLWERR